MECRDVKENLSAYLDREMDVHLIHEIDAHLQACPDCLQESQQLSRTWELLGVAPKIEPSADYVGRFWTRVATQETGKERLIRELKNLLGRRKLVPVLTVLCLMLMIGSTGVIQQINMQNKFSQIKPDDVEMLQNIDLADQFETIKDLDVIRDLDSSQKESTT